MRIQLAIYLCCIAAYSTAQPKISFDKPPAQPALFGAGIISTKYNERDFALSPDGTELFYTLQAPARVGFQTILYCKKDARGNWSKPQVAPFAGNHTDLEPAFSPNGKRLFFCSNRPLSGTKTKDFDIWYTDKTDGKWSKPVNVGAPVNSEADEFYPSITRSGNLYFTAEYKNAINKEDIYLAKFENGKYAQPQPLDSAVNSKTYEFNAFVSPDEDFIIFTSYGREDDMGGGDLYMSKKDKEGNWLRAENLKALNSEKLDYCPFVSFDKKILFYTSERHALHKSFLDAPATYNDLLKDFSSILNGGGNIYWVDFQKLQP